MSIKTSLPYLGIILETIGLLSLIPFFFSIFLQENSVPFLITAAVFFGLGSLLDKKFKREEVSLASAIVLAGITLLLVSLIGSIPFLFYTNPFDAFFESVSGFTTTGLTISELPQSMIFWRAFSQWVGGLGILFIFLLLVKSSGISSYYVYKEKYEGHESMRFIGKIYVAYTVLGIVLLLLTGLPLFDASVSALSSISTGASFIHQNMLANVVMVFLMILGGTSFFIHMGLWKRNFRSYLNIETKFFWFLVVIFGVLLSVSLSNPTGFLQAIAALTTSGFSFGVQTDISKLLLIILMFIGGYAGSTAGGIKLIRLSVLSKSTSWLNKKISLPDTAVLPFKFDKKILQDSEITVISLFVFLFVVILGVTTLVLSFLGLSPLDALFQTLSAQSNTGLSVAGLAEMHVVGKIILIINMIFGRLEIFPIFALIYRLFK